MRTSLLTLVLTVGLSQGVFAQGPGSAERLLWSEPTAVHAASQSGVPAERDISAVSPEVDLTEVGQAAAQNVWWDKQWEYRLNIVSNIVNYSRYDKPLEFLLDTTNILDQLQIEGPVDLTSLRLVEVDYDGHAVDENAPFQYELQAPGIVRLTLLMTGETPPLIQRRYDLYFDTDAAKELPGPDIDPLVIVKENVLDEGYDSVRFSTPAGVYYYDRTGGGFSSLDDVDGHDWIGFSNAPGAAGLFRGIPNMVPPDKGGYFHPGNGLATTTLLEKGPVKASLVSTAAEGTWQVQWDFYPAYATMTVLKTPADVGYWFLYEGTPGGLLETAEDFVVRSPGISSLTSETWLEDLDGPEWVYFGDPGLSRSLFLAQHTNDTIVDSYRPLDELMTVFGFGRGTGAPQGKLKGEGRRFAIGLVDSDSMEALQARIRSATAVATADVSPAERQMYYLSVITQGGGNVLIDPQKEQYARGETVHLQAVADPGWQFVDWQGDLQSDEQTVTVEIDGDMTLTAVFEQQQYLLTINKVGLGDVIVTPEKPTYLLGDQVLLQAVADPGWRFAGWQGDLQGHEPAANVEIDADIAITAIFAPQEFQLTINKTGQGTVIVTPEKPTYLFGDQVMLKAEPAANYYFQEWRGDLESSEDILNLTVAGDLSLEVIFVRAFHYLYLPTTFGG